EILASKAKPQPGGTDPGAGQPGGETGPEPPAGGTPGTAGGRRGPAPVDVVRSADISARVNRHGLVDLQRALAWLRDKPVEVTVDLSIHVDGELPRTEFRNAVIEPIEERGQDVTVRTS